MVTKMISVILRDDLDDSCIVNTYWASPSLFSGISMFRRSIVGDSEAEVISNHSYTNTVTCALTYYLTFRLHSVSASARIIQIVPILTSLSCEILDFKV